MRLLFLRHSVPHRTTRLGRLRKDVSKLGLMLVRNHVDVQPPKITTHTRQCMSCHIPTAYTVYPLFSSSGMDSTSMLICSSGERRTIPTELQELISHLFHLLVLKAEIRASLLLTFLQLGPSVISLLRKSHVPCSFPVQAFVESHSLILGHLVQRCYHHLAFIRQ